MFLNDEPAPDPYPDYAESRPHPPLPPVARWEEPPEHQHCQGYALGHVCCGCGGWKED